MRDDLFLSGFTIIRNGIEFDYPFLESIKSALPIVDEFIIGVGKSTDDTLARIQAFVATLPKKEASKFVIFESEWPLNDPEKRKGGLILSEQTNKALALCKGQWCLYLQADEVLHEDDHEIILQDLKTASDHVQGLVFRYVHFYATYNVIQTSRSAYRREIRIVRNGRFIKSVGDAQSFRNIDGQKLLAKLSKARIFHYGWVKHQDVMKAKTGFMDTLYHPDANKDAPATGDNYKFKRFVGLKEFKDTHPEVMKQRISAAHSFDFKQAPKVFHVKDSWKIISGWIERLTGHRPFEYKNYRLIEK